MKSRRNTGQGCCYVWYSLHLRLTDKDCAWEFEMVIHAGDDLSRRTEIRFPAVELYSESKKKMKKTTRR